MTFSKSISFGKALAAAIFIVSTFQSASSSAAPLPTVQAQEIATAKKLIAEIRPAGYDLTNGIATVFIVKSCIKDMKRVVKDIENTNYQTNLPGPNGTKLNGFKDYVGRVNTLVVVAGYANKPAALAGKERLLNMVRTSCSKPAPAI